MPPCAAAAFTVPSVRRHEVSPPPPAASRAPPLLSPATKSLALLIPLVVSPFRNPFGNVKAVSRAVRCYLAGSAVAYTSTSQRITHPSTHTNPPIHQLASLACCVVSQTALALASPSFPCHQGVHRARRRRAHRGHLQRQSARREEVQRRASSVHRGQRRQEMTRCMEWSCTACQPYRNDSSCLRLFSHANAH